MNKKIQKRIEEKLQRLESHRPLNSAVEKQASPNRVCSTITS